MMFQSTHSLRSATSSSLTVSTSPDGFNPRTPCGVRLSAFSSTFNPYRFQSTHSLRSATRGTQPKERNKTMFQSTHSLRSATVEYATGRPASHRFNPRTPCGVRRNTATLHYMHYAFQSTHSLRSATRDLAAAVDGGNVSIHALLAECDRKGGNYINKPVVSIHALLAECDIRTLK